MNTLKIRAFCSLGVIAAMLLLSAPASAQSFRLDVRTDGTAPQPTAVSVVDEATPRVAGPPMSIVERYRVTKRSGPAELRLLIEETPRQTDTTVISSAGVSTRSPMTAPIITVSNISLSSR
jgi:hypothetical protein